MTDAEELKVAALEQRIVELTDETWKLGTRATEAEERAEAAEQQLEDRDDDCATYRKELEAAEQRSLADAQSARERHATAMGMAFGAQKAANELAVKLAAANEALQRVRAVVEGGCSVVVGKEHFVSRRVLRAALSETHEPPPAPERSGDYHGTIRPELCTTPEGRERVEKVCARGPQGMHSFSWRHAGQPCHYCNEPPRAGGKPAAEG